MGKALSLIKRPARDFNIESRAHKIISRDKPVPAPRHNQAEIDQLIKEYPDAYAESLKKNEALDKNLKHVFVVATKNPDSPMLNSSSSRPLPQSKVYAGDYEYGFTEPDVIPKGKTSLRRALQFITDHQTKPEVYTVKKIASDESLPEDTVKQILQYYKVFELYLPEQRETKATFAGPSLPRKKIVIQKHRLEAGVQSKSIT